MVEQIEREPTHSHLVGGLALYSANAAHGPFLHVDERGAPARCGAAAAGN